MKLEKLKYNLSMRIIISGGGTGGHIYPAIAIADALKKREPLIDILFVGAQGRMEMEKVPEAGYPIKGLWTWLRKEVTQLCCHPSLKPSSMPANPSWKSSTQTRTNWSAASGPNSNPTGQWRE